MGLSSSASSSSTKNYSLQETTSTPTYTTGGAGSESPTITGSNNVITDAGATSAAINGIQAVTLAALNQAGNTNQQALGELSDFNANEATAQVTQADNQDSLLATVLGNNQTLAQNVQSGGATTGMDLTTKVVIGALAIMGLLVAIVLFRK